MKIKNSTVESTPMASIEITDKAKGGKVIAWLQLYWTERPGMYGCQICSRGNTDMVGDGYYESKTSGCGYSKDAAGLEEFVNRLTGKHINCGGGPDYFLREHHKGGNFYKLSIAQLRKAIKK